jgi:hypothetical protein
MDLNTLEEIGTFSGEEDIPHASIFSDKYFCYYDEAKQSYIVKDYAHSFCKEVTPDKKYKWVRMKAIADDVLFFEGAYQEFSQDFFSYDFVKDEWKRIDTFHRPTKLSRVYFLDGRLYLIIKPDEEPVAEQKYLYDLWCYDVKQDAYVWKQFKVIQSDWILEQLGLCMGMKILSYDDRVEFCIESDEYDEYKRVVVDKNDGTILTQQSMRIRNGLSTYQYVQKIDHTVLYLFFGYKDGTDFGITVFTFDTAGSSISEETEQSKEILKRMGLL